MPLDAATPDDSPTLRGRYRLIRELRGGGQGTTQLALDEQTGQPVIVRSLSLADVESWKEIDLLEREARILAQLEHPAIPRYVDAFHEDAPDGGKTFYSVRSYVDGEPLDEAIRQGLVQNEARIVDWMRQLLEILVYLQSLHPPVIHRDIKPSNIIIRPDGTLALVDFGAVQVASGRTGVASTVVGTSGFMAPEQLLGRAVPASDLYGIGATIAEVVTGCPPEELPMRRLRLDFRSKARIAEPLARVLDGLLEPATEDRFPSAAAALEALERMHEVATAGPAPAPTPSPRSPAPVIGDVLPVGAPLPPAELPPGATRLDAPKDPWWRWFGPIPTNVERVVRRGARPGDGLAIEFAGVSEKTIRRALLGVLVLFVVLTQGPNNYFQDAFLGTFLAWLAFTGVLRYVPTQRLELTPDRYSIWKVLPNRKAELMKTGRTAELRIEPKGRRRIRVHTRGESISLRARSPELRDRLLWEIQAVLDQAQGRAPVVATATPIAEAAPAGVEEVAEPEPAVLEQAEEEVVVEIRR